MENSVKHQITSARVYYLLSVCLGDLEPTYWRGASWVKETLIAHHLYTLALVHTPERTLLTVRDVTSKNNTSNSTWTFMEKHVRHFCKCIQLFQVLHIIDAWAISLGGRLHSQTPLLVVYIFAQVFLVIVFFFSQYAHVFSFKLRIHLTNH